MPRLFEHIRGLVAENRYVIGEHASERLAERDIMEWQIVAGMADARLLAERRLARPNPVIEVRIVLPDGDECKAVWSLLPLENVAKLVTAHVMGDDDISDRGLSDEG